jgi:hypothetical protein
LLGLLDAAALRLVQLELQEVVQAHAAGRSALRAVPVLFVIALDEGQLALQRLDLHGEQVPLFSALVNGILELALEAVHQRGAALGGFLVGLLLHDVPLAEGDYRRDHECDDPEQRLEGGQRPHSVFPRRVTQRAHGSRSNSTTSPGFGLVR